MPYRCLPSQKRGLFLNVAAGSGVVKDATGIKQRLAKRIETKRGGGRPPPLLAGHTRRAPGPGRLTLLGLGLLLRRARARGSLAAALARVVGLRGSRGLARGGLAGGAGGPDG